MQINGRKIGPGEPPYVCAEISGNHCGDLDNAFSLIQAAKIAGADAVKIQAYMPDTITLDCDKSDFVIKDGLWKGRKLYELYQKAHTPFGWIPDLFKYARDVDITLFASVFDETALKLLEAENCPAYKIASMEITDLPLIRAVAKTGKPIIISTGMASNEDIYEASTYTTPGNRAFLYCISGYPTPMEESNLHRLRETSGANTAVFGISDHTQGIEIPMLATAMGTGIIEKHLMLDTGEEEDAAFSLQLFEFGDMVKAIHRTWKACHPSEPKSEESSRQLRRSLYVVEDIKSGEQFTRENVRSIRPAYGLPPKMLDDVLGKFATCNIERGTAISHEHFSSEEWVKMWKEPYNYKS